MTPESTLICGVLLSIALIEVNAYTVFGSLGSRRFVRPVRSTWRPAAPALPVPRYPDNAYYNTYPSDYEEEVPDDGALYTDTVNYYPPPRYYYGRTLDPVDDLQMEMRNEERGSDLPIGQETWFERQTAAQAAAAERQAANDAFMQNLILAEMYRNEPSSSYYNYGNTDEEVRELKSLSQVKRSQVTTAAPKVESEKQATVRPHAGQKEVAMLRPPSPARNPKSVTGPATGGHAPSVYDTIKHLLSIESKVNNIL